MAMSDNLQKLQSAGVDVSQLPQAHQQVLAGLSAGEIDTMISIKRRLDATGEVEPYVAADNNVGRSFF